MTWPRPKSPLQSFLASSFRQDTGEKLLVSYIFTEFSDFRRCDQISRMKIRCFCELYLHQKISGLQLLSIVEGLSFGAGNAARMLVTAIEHPRSLRSEKLSFRWTVNETILLLVGLKSGDLALLKQMLPFRSEYACYERIRAVLSQDQEENKQNLTFTKCESVTIAPTRRLLKQQLHESRRVIIAQNRRIKMLSSKIARLSKDIKRLNELLYRIESTDTAEQEAVENIDLPVNDSLSDRIMSEMKTLGSVSVHNRTYSPEMLQVAHLLSLTSRRGYRLVRQVLPRPCETTIWNHFGVTMSRTKELITNRKLIQMHVDSLLEGMSEQDKSLMLTIGIDAFTFKTFQDTSVFKSSQPKEFSHGFVFLHIPVDARFPVKVLHVAKKENGCYDARIDAIFDELVAAYRRRQRKVFFKATDGDRYLGSEHEDFFQSYVSEWRCDFQFVVNKVYPLLLDNKAIMPIADPLHFSKNLRGKILDHDVAVVLGDDNQAEVTNAQLINEVLDVGSALDDCSHLGRMRDFYVTTLFTLDNVCQLLRKECFSAAFMIFPYACIFTLLYADNLRNETSLKLAHLAYLALERLYSEAERLCKAKIGVCWRHVPKAHAVTIAEAGYFQRMLHTCIAFGIVISYGPQFVRLDAVGTHLVENAIGIARTTSNSPDYDKIIAAFANGEVRKKIAGDLDLSIHVQRRINDGGAKIDTFTGHGIPDPSWDPRDVVSVLHEACIPSLRHVSAAERDKFLVQLEQFVQDVQMKKLTTPSSVANALIVQRNFTFGSTASSSKR